MVQRKGNHPKTNVLIFPCEHTLSEYQLQENTKWCKTPFSWKCDTSQFSLIWPLIQSVTWESFDDVARGICCKVAKMSDAREHRLHTAEVWLKARVSTGLYARRNIFPPWLIHRLYPNGLLCCSCLLDATSYTTCFRLRFSFIVSTAKTLILWLETE